MNGRTEATSLTRSMGNRIRAMREKAGMTQVELAGAMGYRNSSSITFIEQGQNPIKADALLVLCVKLKITPNELFGWEGSTR